MSILGGANYKITAHYTDDKVKSGAVFFDSFDNLRRTIATTWSKIPHTVKIVGNTVYVDKEGVEECLAQFTFETVTDIKLPDHF